MSEYIAFSSFCKEKKLSIPKDFNVEDIIKDLEPDQYKVSGYKFKKDYLDSIVDSLNFKKVVKREVKETIIKLFRVDETKDTLVLLRDEKNGTDHKKIETVLDSDLIELPFNNNDNRVFDTLTLISDTTSDSVLKSAQAKELLNLNRLKFEIIHNTDEVYNLISLLSE